ncbi:hypothetical protein C1645_841987 [Glomus cerebriforme]|uniref:Uncharacterized protein n=1 Tax=Glomus cerebriforme TaxID=658196 RepID=A0A397RXM6_9GLOM|nr:hypothetical protein C1645_841987 [Glomus cerebriforme]
MRKSRISLLKSFSLHQSTNFSNRNILKKHRREESEITLHDESITENNENESDDDFEEDSNEETVEMEDEKVNYKIEDTEEDYDFIENDNNNNSNESDNDNNIHKESIIDAPMDIN